jgi:hypothetical protein
MDGRPVYYDAYGVGAGVWWGRLYRRIDAVNIEILWRSAGTYRTAGDAETAARLFAKAHGIDALPEPAANLGQL